VSGAVGLSVTSVGGDEQVRFAAGLGLGYAVITGIVPGVRGQVLAGDGPVGGEAAGTLTLTPPISLYLVPFGLGEVGYRWDGDFTGFMWGAGGGLYIGEPTDRFAIQAGYIYREIDTKDPAVPKIKLHGPIIALSFSF